jgi:excisionase family DNA binding protein
VSGEAQQPATPKLAVTAQEAAAMLSISVRTIWREVQSGRLRIKRQGKRVLFPVKWLQEWLEQ